MIELTDTHCHIHSKDYGLDRSKVVTEAAKDGVTRLICVGTDVEDSQLAVDFVSDKPGLWASIGIHPHEAKKYIKNKEALAQFAKLASSPKVVAVGECGLDYYYEHSPKEDQKDLLKFQLELAKQNSLPLIFHVRAAFDDFWEIYDSFSQLSGVIHSFTSGGKVLKKVVERDLYVGLNGIVTFTKDQAQLTAISEIPADRLVLETDAPFLSPAPNRDKICEPKDVRTTAEFLAKRRQETLQNLSSYTTKNAKKLFNLK